MTMNLEKKVDNTIIPKIPKDLFQKRDFIPVYGLGNSCWKFLKEISKEIYSGRRRNGLPRFVAASTMVVHNYLFLMGSYVALSLIYNSLKS